jgi:enoyl-[acyl-carrier-protein] reductase (NADH)
MWYRTARIVHTYSYADVTQNLRDTVNDDASIVNTALTAIMKNVIRVRDVRCFGNVAQASLKLVLDADVHVQCWLLKVEQVFNTLPAPLNNPAL